METTPTKELRELPEEFEGKGDVKNFIFRQIARSERGYVYEVSNKDPEWPKHYEVFKRVRNEYYGVITYPKSDGFGKWAWTAKTLEKALSILAKIERGEK